MMPPGAPGGEGRLLDFERPAWQHELAAAIRDPDVLLDRLELDPGLRPAARAAARAFPLVVPESLLARIEPRNPRDPILLQVLPLGAELEPAEGFVADPLSEASARAAPGLLRKYEGRALLIASGVCPVHCRYCFRRHHPYPQDVQGRAPWDAALEAIGRDPSVHEVLLSGGDPLMLGDARLGALCDAIGAIPHVERLRIHTRMPVVLPSRVTDELLDLLLGVRLRCVVVLHANHPDELVGEAAEAVGRLSRAGLTLLNQSVLLRGVNDDESTLLRLCERLVALGALPYYLHQLDPVAGAAHFEVPLAEGRRLVEGLRRRLPGYAVPRYVREVPGEASKLPLG